MVSEARLARLPELTLPRAPGGSPTPLRPRGREGTVLVLLHSSGCADCLAYLERLAASREQLKEWDGRVLMVLPASLPEATTVHERLQLPFAVLADAEGTCAARCGVAGGSMIIADQWGEVFHLYSGAAGAHEFPAPEEVVEWLRFMAIQCPECQGEAW